MCCVGEEGKVRRGCERKKEKVECEELGEERR